MKHPTEVVTVRAPVDKLIVPVVEALLAFPEVATLYSCQGSDCSQDNIKEWAFDRDSSYVILSVGDGSVVELAVFLDFLADRVVSLDCHTNFKLEVVSGSPQIEIRFLQDNMLKMVEWLRLIRKEWFGLQVELKSRLPKFR